MAQCESGSAYRIGVRTVFVNVYVVVDARALFVDVLGETGYVYTYVCLWRWGVFVG